MFKSGFLERAAEKLDKCLWKYPSGSWRGFFSFLFWSLRAPFESNPGMKPVDDNTCHLACILSGGIGDMLININFLANLAAWLDCPFTIDVYPGRKDKHLAALQSICRGQDFIRDVRSSRQMRRDYDLVLELFRFPKQVYCNSHKIEKLSSRVLHWCNVNASFLSEHPFFFRTSTPAEALGWRYAQLCDRNRLSQADTGRLLNIKSMLQVKLFEDENAVLKKFSLHDRPFITIQRGIGSRNPNESTRLWPLQYYVELIDMIKARYPKFSVVQLGSEDNWEIKGVDIDLRAKTGFEELKAILLSSTCHIDGECGLVHLRHFLHGGPSVVLFGVTSREFLAYPKNINVKSSACPGGCEWLTNSYNRKCTRGFKEPLCMTQLTPEFVFEQIVNNLDPLFTGFNTSCEHARLGGSKEVRKSS